MLLGRAGRRYFSEPHRWFADGYPTTSIFGVQGGVEQLYPENLAKPSSEHRYVYPVGCATSFGNKAFQTVVLDADSRGRYISYN